MSMYGCGSFIHGKWREKEIMNFYIRFYKLNDFLFLLFMQDGALCDPHVFNDNCHASVSGYSAIFRSGSAGTSCTLAGCHFKEIQSPKIATYYQVNLKVFSVNGKSELGDQSCF